VLQRADGFRDDHALMEALHLPEWRAFLRYSNLPGRSPSLVYLTGLGLAVAGTFDRCIVDPALVRRHAVLVDLLGAGLSDAPEAFGYTLDDHARTVATLLDHLGSRGSTIIGYSFGGSVAITLAATRPDLVAALVVAEPNLDLGGGFLSRRIAGQSEDEFQERGRADLVAESLGKARDGNRAWAVTSGMLQTASAHGLHRSAVGLVRGTRPTMRERLLELRMPRALIRGEANSPDRAQGALEASGVEVHVVPGAGHGMMWENPDGFVVTLEAALAGCAVASDG
jgi:pimeloyl-ACP methyl ester carboxylesterase